jgi:hypothetical protein
MTLDGLLHAPIFFKAVLDRFRISPQRLGFRTEGNGKMERHHGSHW